jgi:hypothetical protein
MQRALPSSSSGRCSSSSSSPAAHLSQTGCCRCADLITTSCIHPCRVGIPATRRLLEHALVLTKRERYRERTRSNIIESVCRSAFRQHALRYPL